MKKKFTITKLIPDVFINTILHKKEKHDEVISKVAGIISKLVSDQF